MPVEVATPLAQVLERHTSAPDLCWLGVWDGFGWDYKEEVPETKAIITTIRSRRCQLFRGPLKAIGAGLFQSGIAHQSANLLWPNDRSRFLATDIDQRSTYIGGSGELIDTLLDCPALEAFPVDPEDDISHESDQVNPESYEYGTTITLE